jgi:mannose-6-phosphate isomerase-like protein (cupin superfamily)
VLEGEFTVWAGENKVVLKPGDSYLISPSTPHVVATSSDQSARGLVVAAPSAFARVVETVGTVEETEPTDMALYDRISAEVGDEILGPPGTLP